MQWRYCSLALSYQYSTKLLDMETFSALDNLLWGESSRQWCTALMFSLLSDWTSCWTTVELPVVWGPMIFMWLRIYLNSSLMNILQQSTGKIRLTISYNIRVTSQEHHVSNHRHLSCLFKSLLQLATMKKLNAPNYWPFVRGFHCWLAVSLTKGQ